MPFNVQMRPRSQTRFDANAVAVPTVLAGKQLKASQLMDLLALQQDEADARRRAELEQLQQEMALQQAVMDANSRETAARQQMEEQYPNPGTAAYLQRYHLPRFQAQQTTRRPGGVLQAGFRY